MRIAIPVENGLISPHFGHCQEFLFYDTDREKKTIIKKESISSPPHKPGLLPRWLWERGAEMIIAAGMGSRAITLFNERNIDVFIGVNVTDPDAAVRSLLEGTLEGGMNLCDH